jgi:hypothetical protein
MSSNILNPAPIISLEYVLVYVLDFHGFLVISRPKLHVDCV